MFIASGTADPLIICRCLDGSSAACVGCNLNCVVRLSECDLTAVRTLFPLRAVAATSR